MRTKNYQMESKKKKGFMVLIDGRPSLGIITAKFFRIENENEQKQLVLINF